MGKEKKQIKAQKRNVLEKEFQEIYTPTCNF